ncbi:MAG TPA: L-fuconate dehydratase [Tepidisphaeraceae bacterium]|nr:L-fuconate dehydratase [Tepidisphaeraceae bacterium]
MPITITNIIVRDIRFPTSAALDGSDAMNIDPDYSAAYVILETDHPQSFAGHGFAFTTGRGNEICVCAIRALAPMVLGRTVESFTSDLGAFWRYITGDSQLRWIGPEKGAIHLATAAIVNAMWDLYAKIEGKPLWKLLADMTPEQLVSCIDFRYIADALSPGEAIELLEANVATKHQRQAHMAAEGYPAYTTSAGWLGYGDDKLRRLCASACEEGFTHLKIKVGRDLQDDLRRCNIIREHIGYNRKLMMDANQVWGVEEAIGHMEQLAKFKPWWIEEPTSPDDVLGHARIARAIERYGIGVATGEHCQNRVLFKQFFQANALKFCNLDACRLGGVNECLAVYLMAKKFNIPVCPHAGGVGLCEHVQHLAIWDYIACSATLENRVLEYVDHLHEHFVDPVHVANGRYALPGRAGYSTQITSQSMRDFEYPDGAAWARKV